RKKLVMHQKFIFLFVLVICSVFSAYSQEEEDIMEREFKREVIRPARLMGKIVDAETNKGIDAASVQILLPVRDTLTGERLDSVIAGTFTRSNGDFSFQNLQLPAVFVVKVTSIGFDEFEQI